MAETIQRDVREIREKLRRPLIARAERAHLTGPQVEVMRTVFRSDGLSLKEICGRVGLAHSTVSGIVDRLEARGMLERRTSSADGRVSRIGVSREVRDFMARRAPGLIRQPLARALARATPAERRAILRGLEILRRVAGVDASR